MQVIGLGDVCCWVLGAGILLTRHRASALERRQIGEAGKESKQAVWRGNTGFQGCKLMGLGHEAGTGEPDVCVCRCERAG